MDGFSIVFSVILLLVLAAVFIDIIPPVLRWTARIHIGQRASNSAWQTAVENALLKQLKKTPRIPRSDQTRLTFIERFKGDYSSAALQHWQQAALLLGANEMSGDEKAKRNIEEFIAAQINSKGGWRKFEARPETAMLAFAVLSSPAADKETIKPAMDKTADMLFDLAKHCGTVPYNKHLPGVRFVDTIGMICPFLTKYALTYDCPQALSLAKEQIDEYAMSGLHEKFSIPVHCFERISGAPLGIYGWGRGCGWWAIGLMDTYLVLAENDMKLDSKAFQSSEIAFSTAEFKASLLHKMMSFAKVLVAFQMENGAWDRQVFLKTSGESSATAMLAWFMKKMFEIYSEQIYRQSYKKALGYLMRATRRNGTVDYAQGDTKGIGFYSTKLDAMPAAQGFTVRCFLQNRNDG